MSDDTQKNPIARIPLAELEITKTRLIDANEALVLHEFRAVLQRQAEQDLVIEDLRTVVGTLVEGQIATIEETQILKRTVSTLTRHQAELAERQNILAEVCDRYAAHLEKHLEKQADNLQQQARQLDTIVGSLTDPGFTDRTASDGVPDANHPTDKD